MMLIREARFVTSNSDPNLLPPPDRPEFAFIGRSNVGKSSLINMLVQQKGLAKTSGTPGKTQLINHFSINNYWYLVDLPGYGYAKVGRESRASWEVFTRQYLQTRSNLMVTLVLIDSRLPPQKPDQEFMEWLGNKSIPFVMVFTKADKQSNQKTSNQVNSYLKQMLDVWAELPPVFVTSAENGMGREELLSYIDETSKIFEIGRRQ
jgi:GTP-binding protein